MQACQTVLAHTGLLNGQSLYMPAKHGNNVEAAWTSVFSIDLGCSVQNELLVDVPFPAQRLGACLIHGWLHTLHSPSQAHPSGLPNSVHSCRSSLLIEWHTGNTICKSHIPGILSKI